MSMQNAGRQDLYRYVVEEFAEDYREGEMSRREFLRRLGLLAGGIVGASVLLESLGLGTASAAEWQQAFASIPELDLARHAQHHSRSALRRRKDGAHRGARPAAERAR